MERTFQLAPELIRNTEFKNITIAMKLADIKIGKPYQNLHEAERVADGAWAAAI